MDPVLAFRRCLDLLYPVDDRRADPAPRSRRDRAAARPDHGSEPPARPRRGSLARFVPDRIGGYVPCPSSMVDDRCDRKNAVSPVREPAAFARMGHGSLREVQPTARPRRLLSSDGRWCRHRHSCRDRRLVRRRRRLAGGGAVRGAVDRIACRRSMDKPIPARGGSSVGLGGRRARLEAGRAPHVALLRDLCHGGGPHAAAGQFPGRPNTRTRPPDLAHQSRPLSSLRSQRPRLRMGGNDRDRRALGSNARNDERPPALPRPFLQLV